MKKNVKKLGLVFTLVASLALTTGCSKKEEKMVDNMVDKYAKCCTLGEYKGVEYQETKTVITADDVQYQVNGLLDAYATSTEVTSGTAEEGDTVNIDFVGKIDGVEFEGGSTGGAGSELTLGSGRMIAGFEEQIIGHEVGETFDINVTFPEDYGEPSLAGQDAVFTITINCKYEKEYPEYNDAFVAANTEYDTVAAYEDYLLKAMTEEAAQTDSDYNKAAVVTAVVDASTVNEYPQEEMQKLIDSSVAQVESEASSYNYDLGDFLKTFYGFETVEDFEKEISNSVREYMTEKIVICAIAKAENITVSAEEVAEYKKTMMDTLAITDEEAFDEHYSEEDVAYYALAEKVVDFLVENATPVQATTEEAE